MDDLTPEQHAVAATVGAIQRIAMAIVELPTEGRAAHYAMVRRKFEAVMMEVGIEGTTAQTWLNSTMDGNPSRSRYGSRRRVFFARRRVSVGTAMGV